LDPSLGQWNSGEAIEDYMGMVRKRSCLDNME
jgi:hypothetical protein